MNREKTKERPQKFTVDGKRYTISQLAEKYNVRKVTLKKRLQQLDWPVERALSEPARFSKEWNDARDPQELMNKKKLIWILNGMRRRCRNKNSKKYHNYGGRGISVCKRWNKFENFYEDMGSSYKEGLSIDRIDNDGDYCPENCRWTTMTEQSNNKRNNRKITFEGETLTIAQWSKKLGIIYGTIYGRLEKGFTIERSLSPFKKFKDKIYSFQGDNLNATELAKKYNMNPKQVLHRLYIGWPIEKALTIPVKKRTPKT